MILALLRLMRLHSKPAFIRSDNGAEFTATAVMKWLQFYDKERPHSTFGQLLLELACLPSFAQNQLASLFSLCKRPAAPRRRERGQVVMDARSGSNSSILLFGQAGNFSSVSLSQA